MKRILVVDDDRVMLSIMRDMLEAAGYYVATLDRGRGTLACIKAQQPDLLILDVWLPDLGGGEVAGIVRATGDPIPILFTSGLMTVGDTLGGHAFLPKPFAAHELLGKVRALIGAP